MTHLLPSRGFTLVETLVAISVLAVALVGPFLAVRNALNGSYVARDQLVASALAQEGLEYVRSVRDNNYLATPRRDWMDGLSSYACYGQSPTGYCTVDPTKGDVHTDNPNNSAMASYSSIAPTSCTTSGSAPCLYLSPTGLYNQQAVGERTKFKRVVQLRRLGSGNNEVQVTVQVYWTTNGQQYSVTVTDTLRDWL